MPQDASPEVRVYMCTPRFQFRPATKHEVTSALEMRVRSCFSSGGRYMTQIIHAQRPAPSRLRVPERSSL